MTELGRARAAIVIWTEDSINSDWVQSEAGRAHADRKLIPVKAKGLAYKDIPPPFDNMHIENVSERDKILGAVVAKLAEPELQPTAISKLSKKARFELLSWLGIAGAAISLVVNLQGLIGLARWARVLFDSWAAIITYFWRSVLFFLPTVQLADAHILTIGAFAAVNLLLCSTTAPVVEKKRTGSILLAVLILMLILGIGFFSAARRDAAQLGNYFLLVSGIVDTILGPVIFFLKSAFGDSSATQIVTGVLFATVILVTLFLIPALPALLVYLFAKRVFGIRLSRETLSRRLWRIIAAITALIALNYLSYWIEARGWVTPA
jgi:hypothetical protein